MISLSRVTVDDDLRCPHCGRAFSKSDVFEIGDHTVAATCGACGCRPITLEFEGPPEDHEDED